MTSRRGRHYARQPRHVVSIYDQWGQPLPQNDIEIAAAYDWSFAPALFGHVDPATNRTWTHLWHHNMTGTGVIAATYTKQSPSVTVSVPAKFVSGDCFIDLTGINYDEVQNVPINGKADAEHDGTGDVGEMKAKVIIEGAANTTYTIQITDDSQKLDIASAPTSLITDGDGKAEKEFELHAVGTDPSSTTDEITMSASMQPYGGGDPLASTEERLCVYKFEFMPFGDPIFDDPDFTAADNEVCDVSAFKVGTGSAGAAVQCHSCLEERFVMNVRAVPGTAFSGSVRARAKVYYEVDALCSVVKGWWEFGDTFGANVDFAIVKFNIPITGGAEVALASFDKAIKFADNDWVEWGDWTIDTRNVMVPYGSRCKFQSFPNADYGHTVSDEIPGSNDDRLYQLPGDGYTIALMVCEAAKTTEAWSGGWYGCSILNDHTDDQGWTWNSHYDMDMQATTIEEHDGVFEIQ
jgi:hypothetical protein